MAKKNINRLIVLVKTLKLNHKPSRGDGSPFIRAAYQDFGKRVIHYAQPLPLFSVEHLFDEYVRAREKENDEGFKMLERKRFELLEDGNFESLEKLEFNLRSELMLYVTDALQEALGVALAGITPGHGLITVSISNLPISFRHALAFRLCSGTTHEDVGKVYNGKLGNVVHVNFNGASRFPVPTGIYKAA